jgi:AcrR family transcriptional regulator
MEQVLDLKKYIIEESDKLFCQYGFKSVTMDDIAKHLSMSKKTIYQNFADKNELVDILIADKLGNQSCKMNDCAKNAKNAIHEIFLTIADIKELMGALNPKLFYDLQKYHPKAWLKFRNFKEKNLLITIHNNLKRGIEEGLYRSEINVDILSQLRLDHSSIVFQEHDHYTMNKYNIAQVIIEITEHFLYGISNEKGLALIATYKKELQNNQ